ncbi:hypothetical protein ACFPM3_08945 [Streptomyces coeruleoprunus]|uniref:Uncharacterized protein n=1 Tax=Streptomyces coeruleoprunus TaxID=285563 RepID=A0ABV9XE74_9ACTN
MHPAQRVLAFCALFATLPGLWIAVDSIVALLFPLVAVVVAIPLFVRPRIAFVRVCVCVGALLLVGGVLFVLLGLFLFLPSAVLLLLAAGADLAVRPRTGRVLVAAGALLTAAVVAVCAYGGWHFYLRPALAEPHAYRAVLDPDAGVLDEGLGDEEDRLRAQGAAWVYGSASDEGEFLEVGFRDDLPADRREDLRRQIELMPGVRSVALCPVSECG